MHIKINTKKKSITNTVCIIPCKLYFFKSQNKSPKLVCVITIVIIDAVINYYHGLLSLRFFFSLLSHGAMFETKYWPRKKKWLKRDKHDKVGRHMVCVIGFNQFCSSMGLYKRSYNNARSAIWTTVIENHKSISHARCHPLCS